jgi:hypothetical protein
MVEVKSHKNKSYNSREYVVLEVSIKNIISKKDNFVIESIKK